MKHPSALRSALFSLSAVLTFASSVALAQTDPAVAPTPSNIEPAVDDAFKTLMKSVAISRLLESVKSDHQRTVTEMRELTEIPAPPFKEHDKAVAFLSKMRALGLPDAYMDKEGNVIGLRRGTGGGPKLLISAHLDTVFQEGTDVKVKERDGKLFAPGISDDTRGLSSLLSWLKVLNDNHIETVGDLLIVASVGEEELGNLRGMKAIFRDNPDIDGMVGLEPSAVGSVIVLGPGSHRYEFVFKGPGGHSYGAFGKVPSAIHGMGRAIARISELHTPLVPKTTFTVGTVSGGTSVNAIAADARMTVDIRSDEMAPLVALEREILAAVDEAVAAENERWDVSSLTVTKSLIGDRSGGTTAPDSVIVQTAVRANAAFGRKTILRASATDANVPMALGIPAVVVGSGGVTGGFHTLGEWIDVTDAWKGSQSSLLTVLGLVGVAGVSQPLLTKSLPRVTAPR